MEKQSKINEYFWLKINLEQKLNSEDVDGIILIEKIDICERYLCDPELESIHQDILSFIIKLYSFTDSSTSVVRLGLVYIRKFGYDLDILKYLLGAYIRSNNFIKAGQFLEDCRQNCEFTEWVEEELKTVNKRVEKIVNSKEISDYNERIAFRKSCKEKVQAERADRIRKAAEWNLKIKPCIQPVVSEQETAPEETLVEESNDTENNMIGDRIFYEQNVARIFKNFNSASSEPKKVLSKHTPYRSYLVKQNNLMIRLESEKQETVIEDVNELLSLDPSLANRLLQIEILFVCEEYDKALNRLSRIKTYSGMKAEDLNIIKRMAEIIKSVFYDSSANIAENHETLQDEIRNILIRKEQK